MASNSAFHGTVVRQGAEHMVRCRQNRKNSLRKAFRPFQVPTEMSVQTGGVRMKPFSTFFLAVIALGFLPMAVSAQDSQSMTPQEIVDGLNSTLPNGY
jgi:hypothetical protein